MCEKLVAVDDERSIGCAANCIRIEISETDFARVHRDSNCRLLFESASADSTRNRSALFRDESHDPVMVGRLKERNDFRNGKAHEISQVTTGATPSAFSKLTVIVVSPVFAELNAKEENTQFEVIFASFVLS